MKNNNILDDYLAKGDEDDEPERSMLNVVLSSLFTAALLGAAGMAIIMFLLKCLELYNLLK